jgi:hypothetical protein
MLRFRCESPSGPILAMGLSFDNLRLLEEHRPIEFDLAPYGTNGQLMIAYGDIAIAEALTAAMPEHKIITLHPNTMSALRRGEVIDVPFGSLEVSELSRALLFAGKTERALVDMLRDAGLVAPTTALDWTEYEQHERNEVADCEACRERRECALHGESGEAKRRGESGEAKRDAGARLPLRERIYRHPNLVAFGVLLFAALVTLLVRAIR